MLLVSVILVLEDSQNMTKTCSIYY